MARPIPWTRSHPATAGPTRNLPLSTMPQPLRLLTGDRSEDDAELILAELRCGGFDPPADVSGRLQS